MTANTSNRAYTYPQSSDNVNLWTHFEELADDIDTDVNTLVTPVVETTAANVATASANFTVNSARAATMLGGKLVQVQVSVTNANTLTETSGNIADVQACTIATAYRPDTTVIGVWSTGTVGGDCTINPDGSVFLRTSNGTVSASAANLRIEAAHIKA